MDCVKNRVENLSVPMEGYETYGHGKQVFDRKMSLDEDYSREELSTKLVVQDYTVDGYLVFDSLEEFWEYNNSLPEHLRSFSEVVYGDVPRASMIHVGFTSRSKVTGTKIVNILKQVIRGILDEFIASYHDTVGLPKTPKDLVVMDECGKSTRGLWLYSFHIVAPSFTFANYDEANAFIDKVLLRVPKNIRHCVIPSYDQHVDFVRILGSTYLEDKRNKKISPFSRFLGTNVDTHRNDLFIHKFSKCTDRTVMSAEDDVGEKESVPCTDQEETTPASIILHADTKLHDKTCEVTETPDIKGAHCSIDTVQQIVDSMEQGESLVVSQHFEQDTINEETNPPTLSSVSRKVDPIFRIDDHQLSQSNTSPCENTNHNQQVEHSTNMDIGDESRNADSSLEPEVSDLGYRKNNITCLSNVIAADTSNLLSLVENPQVLPCFTPENATSFISTTSVEKFGSPSNPNLFAISAAVNFIVIIFTIRRAANYDTRLDDISYHLFEGLHFTNQDNHFLSGYRTYQINVERIHYRNFGCRIANQPYSLVDKFIRNKNLCQLHILQLVNYTMNNKCERVFIVILLVCIGKKECKRYFRRNVSFHKTGCDWKLYKKTSLRHHGYSEIAESNRKKHNSRKVRHLTIIPVVLESRRSDNVHLLHSVIVDPSWCIRNKHEQITINRYPHFGLRCTTSKKVGQITILDSLPSKCTTKGNRRLCFSTQKYMPVEPPIKASRYYNGHLTYMGSNKTLHSKYSDTNRCIYKSKETCYQQAPP